MKKTVWILVVFALIATCFGCNSKGSNQPVLENKGQQKAGTADDKKLALTFLQGVRDGDKKTVYAASNLTTDFVNESREKLIHPAQHKQTDEQRKDSEHALRISGNIDFFIAKLRKILPKSSTLLVTETKAQGSTTNTRQVVHFVKIAYTNKAEAIKDKTGKQVKEMIIHLQQNSRMINNHWIHEFSFDSKDFDKMADKDFEVLSYL